MEKRNSECRIIYILLAAGNSIRFGENKLLFPFHGKKLYRYAVDAALAASIENIVLVTQYETILKEQCKNPRIVLVKNRFPDRGISYSIRLGLLAAGDADGYSFLVCDQPYLSGDTLKRMHRCFLKEPECIVSASDGNRLGNPVVFPSRFRKELLSLEGDEGGKQIWKKYSGIVHPVYVDGCELIDLDRPPS